VLFDLVQADDCEEVYGGDVDGGVVCAGGCTVGKRAGYETGVDALRLLEVGGTRFHGERVGLQPI
jgi:hypothetical protein